MPESGEKFYQFKYRHFQGIDAVAAPLPAIAQGATRFKLFNDCFAIKNEELYKQYSVLAIRSDGCPQYNLL